MKVSTGTFSECISRFSREEIFSEKQKKKYHTVPYRLKLPGVDIGLTNQLNENNDNEGILKFVRSAVDEKEKHTVGKKYVDFEM